jgi:hypothetical protein
MFYTKQFFFWLAFQFPVRKQPAKLPITINILYKFLCVATLTNPLELVLFAVACVGVDGMFRASDIVHRGPNYTLLLRQDTRLVGVDAYINLRSGKHDYSNRGVVVRLHSTKYATSPVPWLKLAMKLAPAKAADAPMFQNPDLGNYVSTAPGLPKDADLGHPTFHRDRCALEER